MLIYTTIQEDLDRKLHTSPFLASVIDESTEVAIYKKLVIYIRLVDTVSGVPSLHFARDMDIVDGKAETIVHSLLQFLKEKGVSIGKITSLASDRASVTVAIRNGVGARLRTSYCPHLVQIHCVAHRLALVAANAFKSVPYFDEFQRTIKHVYFFYSSSAVRYNSLMELQCVLDDNPNLRTIALKKPASFRWLSLHQAVKAVFSVYPWSWIRKQLPKELLMQRACYTKFSL